MPPYLNVYGQAQQKTKFWDKNIMFWAKMAIFSGPKIFKSSSADQAHPSLVRMCSCTLEPAGKPSPTTFKAKRCLVVAHK